MMMHRLASCLILLIADDFLTDAETRRWATSCFECLRALRRYPIKQVIPLPQVADLIQRTTDAATDTVFPYPTIRPLHFGLPSRVLVGDWSQEGFAQDRYRLMMANLPKTVRTLELEWNFNDDISVFPPHLRSLRFRNDYDMAIGGCFNRSVTNWRLPESLLELHFPTDFNQCLDGLHLPSQLRILILGSGFKHSIRSLRLPAGLETFSAGGAPDIPQLPSSLLRLRLGDIVDSTLLSTLDWPPSLTEVEWGSFSNFNASLQGVHLPNSVRSLSLPYSYNLSLEDFSFPTSLTRLRYGDEEYSHLTPLPWDNAPKLLPNGNQNVDRLISIRQLTTIPFPPLLTSVSFLTSIPESLRPNDWPLCVRELYLSFFKQPLASVHLPQHLEVLVLDASVQYPVDESKRLLLSELLLPPSLLEFHIGRYCDDGTLSYAPWSSYYSLHGLHLPDGLRVFSFLSEDHYAGSLADLPPNVPSSLRQLRLWRDDQWDHQAWRQWPIPDDCCVDIQQPEGGPLPDDWDNDRDM